MKYIKSPKYKVAKIVGKILREITSEYTIEGQKSDNQYHSTFILV